jgi:hypothetical protein
LEVLEELEGHALEVGDLGRSRQLRQIRLLRDIRAYNLLSTVLRPDCSIVAGSVGVAGGDDTGNGREVAAGTRMPDTAGM